MKRLYQRAFLFLDNASPTWSVFLFLSAHLFFWTFFSAISHTAPDWDNVEEWVWATSLQWGYYKHPPLPTWLTYCAINLLGQHIWVTFLLGQLSVIGALFFVWKLGCAFVFTNTPPKRQAQYALIAMIMTSLISYFTVRGLMNNHNTMQLFSIAGAIYFFYQGIRHEHMQYWCGLGIFAGLAMLTKYSALIYFFGFFVYLLYSGQWRKGCVWRGILVAILLAGSMLSPHIYWLFTESHGPLHYLNHSLSATPARMAQLQTMLQFVITNVGRLAPFMLVLLFFVYQNHRASASPLPTKIATRLAREDRDFILIVGCIPFFATLFFAGLFNVPLTGHWASTFFLLWGCFSWWYVHDIPKQSTRLLFFVLALQLAMSIGYALTRVPLAYITHDTQRAAYPGKQVSAAVLSIWNQYNATPLSLVASDTWTGGNITIHATQPIKVLINGETSTSPWVNMPTDSACGMLVVVDRTQASTRGAPPSLSLMTLYEQTKQRGHIRIPWGHEKAPPVLLDWGIIPSTPSCIHKG